MFWSAGILDAELFGKLLVVEQSWMSSTQLFHAVNWCVQSAATVLRVGALCAMLAVLDRVLEAELKCTA